MKTSDGRFLLVQGFYERDFGPEGKVERLRGIMVDITERKQAELELKRVNAPSAPSAIATRLWCGRRKKADLLSQVCETLVRVGGYRMAWVGFAEHDEAKSVRPVAQAGFEDGYLQTANISWADTERGQGPTGRTIRTGKTEVARDMLVDPSLAPWRDEARKRGYASA